MTISARALTALFALCTASAAFADGRTEINQTSVNASGGFPFTISAAGNYVLTGNLTVPAGTDGLLLTTNEFTLDLNGFAIAGPATCASGSCAAGSGSAIRGLSGIAHAKRVTIRNGTVRGFAGKCVQLGPQALVESLLVTECGRSGIEVSNGSIVLRNRVLQTGENGLSMLGSSPPPTYAHNTIADSGLGGGTGFYDVSGGRASAGNTCSDKSCSPEGQRRFYLTDTLYYGNAAASACAAGFGVAGLGEIIDPTSLYYEPNLGLSVGPGALPGGPGWVVGDANENCSNYTSSSGDGTVALLGNHSTPSPNVSPWYISAQTCATTPFPISYVWCIEQ